MTDLAPGAVTTADLYRVMVAMHTDVTKALERLAVIESRNQAADFIHNDHEARLRDVAAHKADQASLTRIGERVGRLESFRAKLAGVIVTAGLIEGAVGYWIGHVLH